MRDNNQTDGVSAFRIVCDIGRRWSRCNNIRVAMHNPPSRRGIPNSKLAPVREIPCYAHQLGQSFAHLLGNIEKGKSEKKFFGIWSGSPRRNLLVAFGSALAYLEKTPASEV